MRAMGADERGPGGSGNAAAGPTAGRLPRVGARVVVRHRLPAADPATGARLTDVVGDLVAADGDVLVVSTRHGRVRVDAASVEVVHEVPPRPSRRGAPHRALSVADLQRVMLGAWPAMETARLGDWVLRASRGFTHRANSVMTAGSPGRPLGAALDEVEAWYARRGLPSDLTVAGPVGFVPAQDPLAAELLARGYAPRVVTRTLTASVEEVLRAGGPASAGPVEVTTSQELSEEWLEAFRGYRPVDDVAARAVLTGSPAQDLATARTADGRVVGIGRLGVASAWGGVAAMWVDPRARRTGVASAVLATLAARARGRGIRSLHLQTDTDNTAALRLYAKHGFGAHHEYVNLRR